MWSLQILGLIAATSSLASATSHALPYNPQCARAILSKGDSKALVSADCSSFPQSAPSADLPSYAVQDCKSSQYAGACSVGMTAHVTQNPSVPTVRAEIRSNEPEYFRRISVTGPEGTATEMKLTPYKNPATRAYLNWYPDFLPLSGRYGLDKETGRFFFVTDGGSKLWATSYFSPSNPNAVSEAFFFWAAEDVDGSDHYYVTCKHDDDGYLECNSEGGQKLATVSSGRKHVLVTRDPPARRVRKLRFRVFN